MKKSYLGYIALVCGVIAIGISTYLIVENLAAGQSTVTVSTVSGLLIGLGLILNGVSQRRNATAQKKDGDNLV